MEGLIDRHLTAKVPGFEMGRFMSLLADRQSDMSGDVMDLLSGLADFQVFKENILAHKAVSALPPALLLLLFELHKEPDWFRFVLWQERMAESEAPSAHAQPLHKVPSKK